MFSDIVTQKSDAKRDIQGALLGLLVVMAAVVVLTIINPDLTTFNPEITGIDRAERPNNLAQQQLNAENEAISRCDGSSVCVVTSCNSVQGSVQGPTLHTLGFMFILHT